MRSSLLNRGNVNRFLAVGGIVVVLFQVLLMAFTRLQVTVVLAGILINQVGVWGLAARMMPERRVYTPLRDEVEAFIDLVRELNDEAKSGEARVEGVRGRMHEAVDRMAAVAGKSG